MQKIFSTITTTIVLSVVPVLVFASDALDQLMNQYQSSAEQVFSSERGAAFWQEKSPNGTSCRDCHNTDLTSTGKHSRTGKMIAPMAVSVNPERLTDSAFIEKWLYRNCKAVWARECSAQEKGDVLLWISQQ